MDFTIFGSCLIKKIGAISSIFQHSCPQYIVFLFVLDAYRICSIVSKFRQFENQHNQNTGHCDTKTVTFEFFLSWLFYSKNSDNLFNSMLFNVLYLEK